MQTYIIVAIVAYLLGSIPFGYILVRLFRKEDIRLTGSGNIGATNVARSGARGLGIVTLMLDAAKGFAAVKFGMAQYCCMWVYFGDVSTNGTYLLGAIAAIFAILGHMYPIWLKFKGGKGVATGVGVFLALAPKAVGLVLVIFLIIVWFSRYVSLGSIVATAAFPVLAWLLYRKDTPYIVFIIAAVGAFLIIAKHHQNIRRLLAGTEHRLGEKKTEVRA
jgi:acyl phosphate:glycerol-3-phosphate acyltransferase